MIQPTHIDTAELQTRVNVLSLDQKARLLTGADFWSLYPEPAAGLRRLVVSDGPAGVAERPGTSGTLRRTCPHQPLWPPAGTRLGSSVLAGCLLRSRDARVSTCCSHPRSICTVPPTEAGTSSASPRTLC